MTVLPQTSLNIVLVGDYNPAVIAHQAIPQALTQSAARLGIDMRGHWLSTTDVTSAKDLAGFDAIWCVPASPYQSEQGALSAIRYARESLRPFLGTCGGFQHAILEYARNVMGWQDAGHAETSTEGRMVISPLTCSLVEKSDTIILKDNSVTAMAYGETRIHEGYHCNYGIDTLFASELNTSPLTPVGWDQQGDIRAVELTGHPFFVATLFQHERRALNGQPSPLVDAFLKAAKEQQQ
ncbi:CTP synthase [uncultured Cedecea sp.]|uniref:CTP synthase C-terminal region-related (seleno)protein n=1 Tax=uncultured Cedecea sp. TaxID=988762 RepID=UPI00261AA030|nr:CTP synthase [uncultured Cedecea sp.]